MPQFPWKTPKSLCLPKLSSSSNVIIIIMFVCHVAGWNRARVSQGLWKTLDVFAYPNFLLLLFVVFFLVVGCVTGKTLGKDATVSLKDVYESLPTQTFIIIKCHHHHVCLLCGWLKLGKGATRSLKDVGCLCLPKFSFFFFSLSSSFSLSVVWLAKC